MKQKFFLNKFFFKISAIFILAFGIFFLGPFIFNLEAYKNKLELTLSSTFDAQVKIESNIEYSIKFGPKIIINNIFFENNSEEGLSGNINSIEISINPIDVVTKKFNLHKIKLLNGSISVPYNFIERLIKENNNQFSNLQFENMDFKIFNNNSEFQLDGNHGSLISQKNQLIASEIRGSLGTYNYQLRFKDNLINFSIPRIKLEIEYQLKSDKLQNSFLQIKSANNLFFPGLDNIYLRANVILEKDDVSLKNIKLTSSTYNGFGSVNFKTNPNLTITTDLTFGRTNFTNIPNKIITNFFQNTLFDLASMFNANFKVNFKHILIDQDYFEDLYLDIKFLEGDIIINNFELVSNSNNLIFSGRIVDENKDKLFFFTTKFRTKNLKKLCLKICKNPPLKENYSMVAEGVYNIRHAKLTLDDFFSDKKYNKQDLTDLSNKINTMNEGSFERFLQLKNFLSLY